MLKGCWTDVGDKADRPRCKRSQNVATLRGKLFFPWAGRIGPRWGRDRVQIGSDLEQSVKVQKCLEKILQDRIIEKMHTA